MLANNGKTLVINKTVLSHYSTYNNTILNDGKQGGTSEILRLLIRRISKNSIFVVYN